MAAVGLPRDGTLGMGVHAALGGATVARGHSPAGADAGRDSAFGWETIAGKASWRGSDDYVSTSLAGLCMYMCHACVHVNGDSARREAPRHKPWVPG